MNITFLVVGIVAVIVVAIIIGALGYMFTVQRKATTQAADAAAELEKYNEVVTNQGKMLGYVGRHLNLIPSNDPPAAPPVATAPVAAPAVAAPVAAPVATPVVAPVAVPAVAPVAVTSPVPEVDAPLVDDGLLDEGVVPM